MFLLSSSISFVICPSYVYYFLISVPALGKRSDPAIFALKFAHNVICLRSDKFRGDIQDILDSSALFEFQDDTITNLRLDCIYFIQRLHEKFITSRIRLADSGDGDGSIDNDVRLDMHAQFSDDESSHISSSNAHDGSSQDSTFHSDPINDEYSAEHIDDALEYEDELYQPNDSDDSRVRVDEDMADEDYTDDMEDAARAAASVLMKGDVIEYTRIVGSCDAGDNELKTCAIVSIQPLVYGGHRIMLDNNGQLNEGIYLIRRVKTVNPVTGEMIQLPEPLWLLLGQYTLICDEVVYGNRVRHPFGLSQSEASVAARRGRNMDRNEERSPRCVFPWTQTVDEYDEAATTVNICYRKLCEIGQIQKLSEGKIDMLTVMDQRHFNRKKAEIYKLHKRAITASKNSVRLPSVVGVPDRVPLSGKRVPSVREVKQSEETLVFEHKMMCYQIRTCERCRENKDVFVKSENELLTPYRCPSNTFCCMRNNDTPNFFLEKNLHPVWYEREEDGSMKLDTEGKKIVRYDIPPKLQDLTISEGLLIRRFAPYIPSIHIRNDTYGLHGHCVTFPQQVEDLCDVLPQRKDTILPFVRQMHTTGSTTSTIKNLRVNRLKVLNALHWLKRHHTGYHNITIEDDNLDWMEGRAEDIIASETELAEVEVTEKERDEFVSTAHEPLVDGEVECFTAQCDTTREIPTSEQAVPIIDLVEIAQTTGQASKVLNFPFVNMNEPVS